MGPNLVNPVYNREYSVGFDLYFIINDKSDKKHYLSTDNDGLFCAIFHQNISIQQNCSLPWPSLLYYETISITLRLDSFGLILSDLAKFSPALQLIICCFASQTLSSWSLMICFKNATIKHAQRNRVLYDSRFDIKISILFDFYVIRPLIRAFN